MGQTIARVFFIGCVPALELLGFSICKNSPTANGLNANFRKLFEQLPIMTEHTVDLPDVISRGIEFNRNTKPVTLIENRPPQVTLRQVALRQFRLRRLRLRQFKLQQFKLR